MVVLSNVPCVCGVPPCLDVVPRTRVHRLGGDEQNVARLPGRDDEGVHSKGLDIERVDVDVDDDKRVVGNARTRH